MKKKFSNLGLLRKKSLNIHSKKKYVKKSTKFLNFLLESNYNYLFDWMGVPVIQLPNDILIIQELIYKEQPDLILECGIGHGGMLIFYSSILNLIGKKKYNIIGVDIFIRKVNKNKIKNHKLSKNITLFETSSIEDSFINQFNKKFNKKSKKKIIFLDSNHTKDHVLEELN